MGTSTPRRAAELSTGAYQADKRSWGWRGFHTAPDPHANAIKQYCPRVAKHHLGVWTGVMADDSKTNLKYRRDRIQCQI